MMDVRSPGGPAPRPRRKSRRRWAAAVVVRFVAAFVALNLVTVALEPQLLQVVATSGFNAARASWYLRSTPPADVMFMGSSRVFFGLDPVAAEHDIKDATGVNVRALNLGLSAADIDDNYLILKNVIDDAHRPSVIVYGISEYELNSATIATSPRPDYFAQLLRPDDAADFAGGSLEERVGFFLKQSIPLYHDDDLIRNAVSTSLNSDDPHHKQYVDPLNVPPSNGFLSTPRGYRYPFFIWNAVQASLYRPLPNYQFDGPHLDHLHAFLSLAQARGIKVVLVNMPVTPLLRTEWDSRAALNRYVSLVRAVAAEHDVPLLDLYQDSGRLIPPSSFLDGEHLNQQGADIVTAMVARDYLIDDFKKG